MKTALLIPIFLSLLLCQCTTIDPAKKASIKRVVVACNVGRQITRHHIGFTAFGNKEASVIRSPELDRGIAKVLREETAGHFPEVIIAQEEPEHVSKNMFAAQPKYGAWAQALASKYKADTVLLITGFHYYPYGAPSYMTAEGLGIWHLGNAGQVQCYRRIQLLDAKTGKNLGNFVRLYGGRALQDLEFKADFKDYSAADQTRIIDACVEEFRVEVAAYMKGIGY